MGFDNENDGKPVVNISKRTTKVNIWMAVLVVAFLAAGMIVSWAVLRHRYHM